MTTQVKLWGNSQGIRIPKNILETLKIGIDEMLDMEVIDNSIVIRKKFAHKSLEQRYAEFEGEMCEIEEFDWGEPVGREIW